MSLIRCDDNCAWIKNMAKGRQELCRAKRSCVCTVCGPLQAIDLNLYESCAATCNEDDAYKRPKSTTEYYAKLDAADIYRRYKVTLPGFDPMTLPEYQQNKDEQNRIDKQTEEGNATTKKLIYVIAGLAALFLIFKLLK